MLLEEFIQKRAEEKFEKIRTEILDKIIDLSKEYGVSTILSCYDSTSNQIESVRSVIIDKLKEKELVKVKLKLEEILD